MSAPHPPLAPIAPLAGPAPADLATWQPRPRPQRIALAGLYTRLEPLDPALHGESLFAQSMAEGAQARHAYLFESPMARAPFEEWLQSRALSEDPLFYAVVDAKTGHALGRQALMRMEPNHGGIELGNILWGPGMARTRLATEAFFLHACYVFETLGYRRFEWKCNALNAPSIRAAKRFGFRYEGTFRQHMVVKGQNRDTAWFSLLDSEWPALRARFAAWLSPDNFEESGQEKRKLQAIG